MSYVVVAGAAMSIGGKLMKGFGAMGNKADVQAGKTAAYDIYQEQLGLLGEKKDTSIEQAQGQYISGTGELTAGAIAGQRDISYATGKTGLATSGAMGMHAEDFMAKIKSDTAKLVDTRSYNMAQADYAYRSGKMSAEDAYLSKLTDLDSTPTTFLEGMFG